MAASKSLGTENIVELPTKPRHCMYQRNKLFSYLNPSYLEIFLKCATGQPDRYIILKGALNTPKVQFLYLLIGSKSYLRCLTYNINVKTK